jgi:hypothetical protein
MALTPKQQRNCYPLPASRPDSEKFSEDALQSRDAEARGHQAATQDPYLNGEDARRRYEQGAKT